MVKKSLLVIALFCAIQINSMELKTPTLYGQEIKSQPIVVDGFYDTFTNQPAHECKSPRSKKLSPKALIRFLQSKTSRRSHENLIG